MSNGEKNVFERLFKLLAKICMMIVDGARKAEEVAEWLQVVVKNENFYSFLTAPRSASANTDTPADGWAAEWQRFYQGIFGLQVDLSKVQIVDDPGGFGWVVMVAKGLTLNRVYAKCRDLFSCSSYCGDDLDNRVPKNDRVAGDSYARRFRNRMEADEENKSTSANQLASQEGDDITLLERLLLELWYHWKTGGGHLDLVNWTICAGSRYHDGVVPCVGWCGDEFQVDSSHPDDANSNIRSRSEVQERNLCKVPFL